ncbi:MULTISPECIES: tRNA lysidine(34) synthetase TilS [Campylobacter]|uniref:tRNA lysidine(34) synthetase TilS n=1 Tax=Campylobacter TaxID=194 RepID=UPI0014752FF4|nr:MULTISPECIES: tRNA lysidine(34) synthetase TilS [unclassified Campylobacter]MBE3608905.1 tRNA lysidine(34) synthetase TilS [Campylobacter sp. RM12916]
MINLSKESIDALKNGKNLLAFSHGVDSSALFYLLNDAGVEFDIAIVDYNVRAQSKDEVRSAKALAKNFKKKIFTLSVKLEGGNFEAKAREIRYEFFKKIFLEHGYKNLILAHQLDDRLEWFMMQLSRGAGLLQMLGMNEHESREWCEIYRPLIGISKAEILAYLKEGKLAYFVDESNVDEKFKRNFIRAKFATEFLANFKEGVARSFKILEAERAKFEPKISKISQDLYSVKYDENALNGIDRVAKTLGVVMSEAQRLECKRCLKGGCVISGRIAVGLYKDESVLIAPFVKTKMDKDFKEKCRILGMPAQIRGYLFSAGINLVELRF